MNRSGVPDKDPRQNLDKDSEFNVWRREIRLSSNIEESQSFFFSSENMYWKVSSFYPKRDLGIDWTSFQTYNIPYTLSPLGHSSCFNKLMTRITQEPLFSTVSIIRITNYFPGKFLHLRPTSFDCYHFVVALSFSSWMAVVLDLPHMSSSTTILGHVRSRYPRSSSSLISKTISSCWAGFYRNIPFLVSLIMG